MRTGARLLSLSAAALLLGGGVSFWSTTRHTRLVATSRESELEWLRQEYKLTRAQFAAIQEIHHRYAPRYEEMYRAIATADQQAERLISANSSVTPELTDALARREHLEEQCRLEALGQVYAVAGHMDPAQAERYVATMKLRILEPGSNPRTTATHWPR